MNVSIPQVLDAQAKVNAACNALVAAQNAATAVQPLIDVTPQLEAAKTAIQQASVAAGLNFQP